MGTVIDMPIATSAVDSSGEVLLIENVDISDVAKGTVLANWEHDNKTPETAGIGIFRYAKKIMKKEDCETKRQEMFWDRVKKPFIYGICELFDDNGEDSHAGAVAVAAMIKWFANKKEKIMIGASIEGLTLERDGSLLKRAVMKKTAITAKPCNKQCWVDLMNEADLKDFVKNVEDNSSKSVSYEVDSMVLKAEDIPIEFLELRKAVEELNKTLEAGNYNVAPSQLTGGAALQREHVSGTVKNRIKAAVRDWDRKRPLKEVIKATLPEVSDEYVNHFTDMAEEIALRKAAPLVRIGKEHGHLSHSEDQESLINGLYMKPSLNPAKAFEPKHDEYTKSLFDLKNDAGQRVIVKRPELDEDSGADFAHNSMAYSQLAHHYFGLGNHVPHAAAFKSDKLKNEIYEGFQDAHWGAQEHVPDSKSLIEMNNGEIGKKLQPHYESGNLHKLMIMDHILGNSDRHAGNVMVDKKGGLFHIDHDLAFTHAPNVGGNYYQTDTAYAEQPVHQKASEWLHSLDEKTMSKHMMDLGLDLKKIKNSVAAMKLYKKYAKKGYNINKVSSLVDGDLAAINAPPQQGQENGNS